MGDKVSAVTYRIGLILPSSNTAAESEAFELVGHLADVMIHITRVRVTTVTGDAASGRQFAPAAMVAAAELLRDAHVNVIAWAGTSGSWLGINHERELVRVLSDVARVPATTSTHALIAACRSWNVVKVALVTPYIEEIVNAIRATFASVGIEVVRETHLGITDSFACGEVDDRTLRRSVRHAAEDGVDAVLIVCTNFAAGHLVGALERETTVPIFDSTAATIWRSCVIGRHWTPLGKHGVLLSSTNGATMDCRVEETMCTP